MPIYACFCCWACHADLPACPPHLPAGGTLPPEWGTLHQLNTLTLDANYIEGPLPSNWSGMQAVEYIGLQSNRLSGPLPSSWGALASLQLLDLGSNKLGAPCCAALGWAG